jgi:condensin complex subunit 1
LILFFFFEIIRQRAIPIDRIVGITELAVGRLKDKAAQVRKNAIQLLTTLLQYNPFSGQLQPKVFKEKLKEISESNVSLHSEEFFFFSLFFFLEEKKTKSD